MEIILAVTVDGLEVSARLAQVEVDGAGWHGHTLGTDPAALVLPAGVTVAALVEQLREIAVDRDGAVA